MYVSPAYLPPLPSAFGAGQLMNNQGTHDEIFPIEDMMLLLRHGPSPKEARFIPEAKHMGEPASFEICLQWVYDLFGLTGNVQEHLMGLPLKTKFEYKHTVLEEKKEHKAEIDIDIDMSGRDGVFTVDRMLEEVQQHPTQFEVEISA